jgi:hypothetical protein
VNCLTLLDQFLNDAAWEWADRELVWRMPIVIFHLAINSSEGGSGTRDGVDPD